MTHVPLTVEFLLFGDLNMSVDDNEHIALCIQKYIHETKRFWISLSFLSLSHVIYQKIITYLYVATYDKFCMLYMLARGQS